MSSLESPHRGDPYEYTKYTIFNIKKENHPKLPQSCSYGIFPRDLRTSSKNSPGKRAISVRATEVYCNYFSSVVVAVDGSINFALSFLV